MKDRTGTYIYTCFYASPSFVRIGNAEYGLWSFADIMKSKKATFMPEPKTSGETAAWFILYANKILTIRVTDAGYDYTLYTNGYELVDKGRVDEPHISMQEARTRILDSHGLRGFDLKVMDCKKVAENVWRNNQ